MTEKNNSSKDQKPKGEFIIVPQKKALEPDFFKALMEFQYGETQEVSNEGFEKMKKSTSIPEKEESS